MPENRSANANKRNGTDLAGRNHAVKSPSDTTLYKPALLKTPEGRRYNHNLTGSPFEIVPQMQRTQVNNDDNSVIDKISKFVDDIRSSLMDGERNKARKKQRRDSEKEKLEQAKERSNRIILEAEQYKAVVQQPKGDYVFDNSKHQTFGGDQVLNTQKPLDDDEFFHVTCHVDQSLRAKICRVGKTPSKG